MAKLVVGDAWVVDGEILGAIVFTVQSMRCALLLENFYFLTLYTYTTTRL